MKMAKPTSLYLPPRLLKEAERVAKREGRTRNELVREAVRRYIADSKWRDRKLGLKESDGERLIQEYRSGS